MSTRHPARTADAVPTQSISAQQTHENDHSLEHESLEHELLAGFDASELAGLSASQLIDLLASDLQLIEEVEHPANGMHQLLQAVQAQAEAGLTPVADAAARGETTTLRMADALSDRDREAGSDEEDRTASVTELERAARQLSEFAEELDHRAMEMIDRDEESLRTAGELLDAQQDLIHRLDELQHQLDQLDLGDSENRSRSVA